MKVRWTRPALQSLAEIIRFIRRHDPAAATRVRTRIVTAAAALDSMEQRYRQGEIEGTREFTVNPWPYIVVYEVSGTHVYVLTVRHAAQLWPPE